MILSKHAARQYVLFVPHMDSSFFEMLDIAIALKDRGKYHPIFLIHWPNNHRAVDGCLENGIEYHYFGNSNEADSSLPEGGVNSQNISNDESVAEKTNLSAFIGWLKSRLLRLFLLQLVLYLLRFSRILVNARSLLRQIQPVCLVLMGDRHVGIETALVRQANRIGVPSLIVPFGLSETAGLVKYRISQSGWEKEYGMGKWVNRSIAKVKPLWCISYDNADLLWNTASWMLAAEVVGIMPKIPWSLGGGGAWHMAVENSYHENNYLKQKVPARKISIVGKPRYDRAAEIWMNQAKHRLRICESLGFDPALPMLVCAVPQMAEHEFLPWPEHWDEIDFLFDSFSRLKPEVNTVLSLHPKSDFAKYSPRADKYGLVIARNLHYDQLIPVCDGFVATYSSTVSLAIAARKPAIVIDFYGFETDLYQDVNGIIVVKHHDQFMPALKRLFSDQDHYDQLVEGQRQAAKTWARFDGKATERVLDLIDDLVERGQEIRKLPSRERRQALPPWSR